MGVSSIISHAEGKKHLVNMKSSRDQIFFKVTKPTVVGHATASNDLPAMEIESAAASTSMEADDEASSTCMLTLTKMQGKQWMPMSIDDKVKKAEILFTLKLVANNYSF